MYNDTQVDAVVHALEKYAQDAGMANLEYLASIAVNQELQRLKQAGDKNAADSRVRALYESLARSVGLAA